MTKEKTLREHLQAAGRARWAGKTAEERKEHARMAARARWDKEKQPKCIHGTPKQYDCPICD